MSSTISVFFHKEITCLPGLLDKYVGRYYNNAIGNAITWTFFTWLFLHFLFNRFVNALLKQMKYPEYLRNRITTTLWNFSFCAGSFMYCYATLAKNNVDLFNFHNFANNTNDIVPGQYILGFVFLSTFYAQTAVWEYSQNCNMFKAIEFLFFTVLSAAIYFTGFIELLFILVYVTNFVQCSLELSRAFSFQLYNKYFMKLISSLYFIFHVVLSVLLYLAVLPLYILIPIGKMLISHFSFNIVVLNTSLWICLAASIYNSAVIKVVKHFIWHMDQDGNLCGSAILDCAMFPARNDTAFNIFQLKKEIEARKEKMDLRRKSPKAALHQHLKCMVVLCYFIAGIMTVRRRLIKQRRQNEFEAQLKSEDIVSGIIGEMVNNAMEKSESTSNNMLRGLLNKVDKHLESSVHEQFNN